MTSLLPSCASQAAGRRRALLPAIGILLAGCATLATSPPPGAPTVHPLDDLTREEITIATKAVRDSGRFTEGARFPIVMAKEPEKAKLAASAGVPRQAMLAVYEPRQGALWEVTVDLPVGVTHFPRPEEWPVMNVTRAGFRVMPVHFFSRNPAMDLPEVPSAAVRGELDRRRR